MKEWRKYNGAIIPNLPPHISVNNTEKEIKKFIKKSNAFFARWESDFDCDNRTDFWFVINQTPMEMEDYDSKTRNKIRKGLKECDVKIITKNDLMNSGYPVYISAFNKYKTYLNAKTKEEYIQEIIITPDFWEYWGVFYDNKLIAYSKVMVIDKYAEYRSTKFNPIFLKHRPSEALFYTMNKNYLNDRKFNYVNNGTRSLSHQTNFPDFLIRKFKFRKAYCKLNMIYNPWIAVIIKVIYPFRFLLSLFSNKFTARLKVLTKHENIRRSCNR